MTELSELARPEMRARTRFHPDQTRRQVREKTQYLSALELLTQLRVAALIDTVDLKHIFCQINTDHRNVHGGRSYLFKW